MFRPDFKKVLGSLLRKCRFVTDFTTSPTFPVCLLKPVKRDGTCSFCAVFSRDSTHFMNLTSFGKNQDKRTRLDSPLKNSSYVLPAVFFGKSPLKKSVRVCATLTV
jgi:hypothetical protein